MAIIENRDYLKLSYGKFPLADISRPVNYHLGIAYHLSLIDATHDCPSARITQQCLCGGPEQSSLR